MLFSRNWLADYVELPDGPGGPAELARRLTLAGLAVETTEEKGDDFLFDIDVTTNRPDCMNHLGLAREIAVLYDRPLKRPAAEPEESAEGAGSAARVRVEDPAGCPRYVARVIRGVQVGPSPDWLRRRLESIGLRSINNVVDVTNFVLWETGQPLHAFDLARLAEATIVVRRARPGERVTTLDGQDRELDETSLIIADAERPVALAGVMGGLDSEVTGATRDILLESAHFDRKTVRVTARRLGMHTDASHRYERGSDPEACADAATRAAALLAEVAGGTVLAGAVDVRADGFDWQRHGTLDLARLEAFAGAALQTADVERWLAGLGFGLEPEGSAAPAWRVTVPSWRYFDFEPRPEPPHEVYPQDLYEEVLRIHGFDSIPSALPAIAGSDGPRTPDQIRRARVRRHLVACGYAEAVNFAFQDPAADAAFPSLRPAAAAIPLVNPLSERYSVMRRSLLPNLVESARFNQRRGARAVRLFEVATVFFPREGALPDQPELLGLVCGGRLGTPWDREMDLDLFDLKGVLDSLAEEMGVRLEARPARPPGLPGLLPGNTAELFLPDGTAAVGYFGRVEAEEGYPLYVAEIAMAALGEGWEGLEVEAPSRFPGIEADFTLTHSLDTSWEEIRRATAELAPPDLVSFGLKDRYRGPGVPEGAVNTTMSFLYNSRERSLTQDEVNERQSGLRQELERRFGWRG
jgi:phenylalanyl-tRNA synthetase beta chain